MHFSENQSKDFVLSGTSALSDLLNLSIIRVFGGVSAILSHQIKNLREYTKDVGDLKCSESQCIIVEIFFVIDTSAKLNNGKTTDQSLRTGKCGKIQIRTGSLPVRSLLAVELRLCVLFIQNLSHKRIRIASRRFERTFS